MEFEKLIKDRYSVRSFKPIPMHYEFRPIEETVIYNSF